MTLKNRTHNEKVNLHGTPSISSSSLSRSISRIRLSAGFAPGIPRIIALFNKAAPSSGMPSKSSSSFSSSEIGFPSISDGLSIDWNCE